MKLGILSDTHTSRIFFALPFQRRRTLRTAQKTRFRKSRVFFGCASGFLLFPIEPAPLGFDGGRGERLPEVLVVPREKTPMGAAA